MTFLTFGATRGQARFPGPFIAVRVV
jgi:hypothetical protein